MYESIFLIRNYRREIKLMFAEYRTLMKHIHRANEIHLRDIINKKYFKGRRMNRIIRIRSPGMV